MAVITGNASANPLNGTAEDDQISGLDGNDTLTGGEGNDELSGGNGFDLLTGGAGADRFLFTPEATSAQDRITDFQLGTDRIDVQAVGIASFETLEVLFGRENGTGNAGIQFSRNGIQSTLIVNGVTPDDLIGADFAFSSALTHDLLVGSGVADDLFGGLGADTLSGGNGNDRLFGEQGDDRLFGNLVGTADGTADGNDQLYAGDGNDQLFGGSQNDYLDGGAGNDRLDGGPGNDQMRGGTGRDVFVLRRDGGDQNDSVLDFSIAEDRLDVSALGIADFETIRLLSSVSTTGDLVIAHSLGSDNVFLFLQGVPPGSLTAANVVFSSANAGDVIEGTTQIDHLFGGLGNDTVSGGQGDDRLFGEQGDDRLFGSTSLAPEGSLDGNDLLWGGAGNDQLFGGSQNDRLLGGNGNDLLDGGTGGDFLDGGLGVDTATYATSSAAVTIRLREGFASGGGATGDALQNVENVTGSAFADLLAGNAQANVLDGGAGADTLIGGEGNDTFVVDQLGDLLSDRAGIDTVQSTIDFTLGASFENLTLLGATGLAGTGNALNNVIMGNAGDNSLNGMEGIDVVSYANAGAAVAVNLSLTAQTTGGAGNDTLNGFEGVTGSDFNDLLTGNTSGNTLRGGLGADTLRGGGGNDVLVGGAGRDVLNGGAGGDRFVFAAAADSPNGTGRDVIADFSAAQGDRIDVVAIDANTALAGDQAFTFIGEAAFSLVAGQLRFAAGVVTGDVNGDGVGDIQLQLTGVSSMSELSFIL